MVHLVIVACFHSIENNSGENITLKILRRLSFLFALQLYKIQMFYGSFYSTSENFRFVYNSGDLYHNYKAKLNISLNWMKLISIIFL